MNRNPFIKMVVVMTISGLFAGCGGVPERDHILRDARAAYAACVVSHSPANVEQETNKKFEITQEPIMVVVY